MTEYFVESWPPSDPRDRARSECKTVAEADELAREIAQEGENAVVLHVEVSYAAVLEDECETLGLRPCVDFPGTLPGWRVA